MKMPQGKKLPKLFVAADDSVEDKAKGKADLIKNVKGDYGLKLNLDLILQDINIIGRFCALYPGLPIMADMKMHNGKRTMRVAMENLAKQGATIVNMHAEVGRLAKEANKVAKDNGVISLAVTITTHQDEAYCQRVFRRSMGEIVKELTEIAMENDFHGVILPGTTLENIKDIDCIKFNPATRPGWYEDKKTNDQEQLMEPGECIKKGATIVSCGSPIFKSPDPAAALQRILEEIGG